MRIVVTGATAGIGLSCVEQLCEQGHQVIGIARSEAKLNDLSDRYPGFSALPCDLADSQGQASLGDHLSSIIETGAVDVLLNNAGYGAAGPVELMPVEQWKAQFDLNIFGTLAVTQATLPYLRRSGDARIINVSSIVSKIYAPCFSPYYSSKHALENITDTLRMELKPQGIQVVSVRPGAVKTGFANTEDEMLEAFAKDSELYSDSIRRMIQWHEKLVSDDGIEAEKVRDVILKAITASRPKPRYTVPAFPANIVVPLLQVIPARAGDFLINALTGFSKN